MSARLFVALELPVAVRAQLAAFGHAAADRDEAVRGVNAASLALTLGEPLWLAPRRPHVLTVALGDVDGALATVRAEVVERLAAALEWEPEARPFRPHVTVARVRRGARPRRDLPDAPRATFAGEAVTLFR